MSTSTLSHESRIADHDPRTDKLQRIESFGGADEFVLPYRRLGELGGFKKFVWIGVGVGAFILLFMIGWIAGPLKIGVDLIMKGQWFGWFFVGFSCLGIFGLRAASLLLAGCFGVLKDKTRTIVSLRGSKIQVTEESFRFKWRRKVKHKRIEKLCVSDAIERRGKQVPPDVLGDHDSALGVQDEDGKDHLLALAYPRELLLELAEQLATELDRANADLSDDFGPLTIERGFQDESDLKTSLRANRTKSQKPTVEIVDADDVELQPVAQPSDSTAELTKHDAGIKIELPPTGFKGASGFLVLFGVLWTAFTTLFLVLLMTKGFDGEFWMAALIGVLFEAVGIGILLVGYNGAKKRTILATAGDQLMLVSESLFGKKRQQWAKSDIFEICVGPSDIEVNDKPLPELQIHDRKGTKSGFLSYRDDKELKWLVSELNSDLGLDPPGVRTIPPADLPQDESGRYLPHASSLASVEHFGAATQITIPGRGMRPFSGLFSTGVIFILCIGIAAFIGWGGGIVDMIIPFAAGAMFGSMGVWCIFYGYVLANRGYVFEVSPERLLVTQTGFMSSKSYDFSRESIRMADIVDSGTKVNARSLKQIAIKGEQQRFSGMTDHSHEDLSLVTLTIHETMSLSDDVEA